MLNMIKNPSCRRWGRRLCTIVTLGVTAGALSACDDLLDVDLPSQLTDQVLNDPNSAQTLLSTFITHFEAGHNEFVWEAFGREDGGEVYLSSGGTDFDYFVYGPDATQFTPMSRARRFAYLLHDRLENEWTASDVPRRSEYLAISSIYAGASLGWMGSALCETAIGGGELMTSDETLALAESWLTTALGEIGAAGGDFEMPFGIASSARSMAFGLRAQVRWMRGDNAGARADAEQVPLGFAAYVMRDGSTERRNKPYFSGTEIKYHELYPVIDWYEGPPNPVTGQVWPNPIPFTGYRHLGILPDGRAVRDDGLPIRTQGPYRTAAEDDAVPDTRVGFLVSTIQGSSIETYVSQKYNSVDEDLPLVNWKEMWLIRAEAEGGQRAIDLVNEVRAADGLPLVMYADPGNAQQIRYMILEERRRALYIEGRYFFTKLLNTDVLWFPRASGFSPGRGTDYQGGVRFIMSDDEFILNDNLTLADRATGCDQDQRPVAIDTGTG